MSAPNQLVEFASPALVQALGWTLLHSLWQGAVLALGASLLLMLLHRHAAAVRYRVSAAALLLLLALSGLTFGYYYRAAVAKPNAVAAQPATSQVRQTTVVRVGVGVAAANVGEAERQRVRPVATGLPGWLATGRTYFEQNMPLLVAGWLLGMLAMTLRFLGGLAYVQRLKHYRVAALPEAWQARLDALALRAGLKQRVRLLASALVPGPLVVGWLRPVVLLPLSAATGLSDRELEAILAHELAHVRRHDYLLNLLQSIAEILFFYHPAVWFLSASLRTERENCCDDLATELCGDPVVLARALASLAALTLAPEAAPRLALGAAGPAGSLLGRVRRLVRHRAEVPTFLEGFGAACVVLAGSAVLVLSTVASLNASPVRLLDRAHRPATAAQPVAAPATAPGELSTETPQSGARPLVDDLGTAASGDTVIVSAETNARLLTKSGRTRLTDIQGLTVVVQDGAGNIRDVYADGRKVPAAELPAYRAALARAAARAAHYTKEQRSQEAADARLRRMEQTAQRMSRQALAGEAASDEDAESLSSDALAMSDLAVDVSVDAEAAVDADANASAAASGYKAHFDTYNARLEALNRKRNDLNVRIITPRPNASREQVAKLRKDLKEQRAQVEAEQKQVQKLRDQEIRHHLNEVHASLKAGQKVYVAADAAASADPEDVLLIEMQRDGLLPDPENYQFSLSQQELIVNGRKQPASVHKKYLQLYATANGRPLTKTGSYNSSRNTNRDGQNYGYRNGMMPAPPAPPAAPARPSRPSVPAPPARPARPAYPAPPAAPPAPPAPPKLDTDRIRAELRRDGLLDADAKNFSLSFSDNSGLIVNGRQQSAAMTAKYRPLLGLSSKRGQSLDITVNGD